MNNKFIHYPLWFFELFTSSKSFRKNPLIGNYWLNRAGLHVARLVIAHFIMYLRRMMLRFSVSAEDHKAFMRDGFLAKENFLSEDQLATVNQEIANFKGETRQAQQGDTLTERSVLEPKILHDYPALQGFFRSTQFKRLCRYTAGHLRPPLLYIETVKSQYIKANKDPQKTYHSDTFHPTMKFWFFGDDVDEAKGPFIYIPGSNKLTWKRIKWEYKMSLKVKELNNGYAANGSFRFTPEDLKELGLRKPVKFTVKANTLLFANTYGVHRRGDTVGKAERTAIWGDSRTNPFIPFPGIAGDWVNELQYKLLAEFRRKADEQAAASGRRSPWKLIKKPNNPV